MCSKTARQNSKLFSSIGAEIWPNNSSLSRAPDEARIFLGDGGGGGGEVGIIGFLG